MRGRVKLLAITGASNVTGSINPIHELAELAHANGAQILVDAAQLAPHRAIDMARRLTRATSTISSRPAHKMYAPFGTGVLIGPREIFAARRPGLQRRRHGRDRHRG